MPSFYSWEEVLTSPDDFSFNSTVVASRDHHPPAGGLAFPNPNAPQGQAQMTEAVELWLPTPGTSDSNQVRRSFFSMSAVNCVNSWLMEDVCTMVLEYSNIPVYEHGFGSRVLPTWSRAS